jgi:hypothetical protein
MIVSWRYEARFFEPHIADLAPPPDAYALVGVRAVLTDSERENDLAAEWPHMLSPDVIDS